MRPSWELFNETAKDDWEEGEGSQMTPIEEKLKEEDVVQEREDMDILKNE